MKNAQNSSVKKKNKTKKKPNKQKNKKPQTIQLENRQKT